MRPFPPLPTGLNAAGDFILAPFLFGGLGQGIGKRGERGVTELVPKAAMTRRTRIIGHGPENTFSGPPHPPLSGNFRESKSLYATEYSGSCLHRRKLLRRKGFGLETVSAAHHLSFALCLLFPSNLIVDTACEF